MPRSSAKPSPKRKPAAKPAKGRVGAKLSPQKAVGKAVSKVAKKTGKKAPKKASKKDVKKAPGKATQAAKPAVKPAPVLRPAPVSKAAVKAPAAPAPALKLAAAKPAPPLKFAQVQAPAAPPVPPPAADPVKAEAARSTTHLPRPGETRDAWLARVAHDYYRFLYATALSITRNNDDAEDAVQNAVVNGLKRLSQLTEDGAVVSWLAMITRNAALDLLRRKKRAPGGGGDATVLPLAAPEAEKEYEVAGDMRQVLANAISVLPLTYQEVVNARHFDGMEVEDIAKKFGMTENNVRVRLFRAYEKLRESVQVRKALGLPVE